MEISRRLDGQGWSRQWRAWLRTLGLVDGDRGVRVKRLEVLPGRITATTQDRSGASCEVEIRFAMWSDEQWQRVIDALGSQALYAAQLLAGDLPPDLERTIRAAGVQLLPAGLDEVQQDCTCHSRQRRPCEHATAVFLALGEMLADDPWLIFRLRGRDQQIILRGLRTQRARTGEITTGTPALGKTSERAAGSGFYRAASTAAHDEEIPPLEQQIEGFWGSGKILGDFRPHIVPAPVELALLRRLGPPPTAAAGSDTYERLVQIYRRISQEALTLAYAADAENGGHENGGHGNGGHGNGHDNPADFPGR